MVCHMFWHWQHLHLNSLIRINMSNNLVSFKHRHTNKRKTDKIISSRASLLDIIILNGLYVPTASSLALNPVTALNSSLWSLHIRLCQRNHAVQAVWQTGYKKLESSEGTDGVRGKFSYRNAQRLTNW